MDSSLPAGCVTREVQEAGKQNACDRKQGRRRTRKTGVSTKEKHLEGGWERWRKKRMRRPEQKSHRAFALLSLCGCWCLTSAYFLIQFHMGHDAEINPGHRWHNGLLCRRFPAMDRSALLHRLVRVSLMTASTARSLRHAEQAATRCGTGCNGLRLCGFHPHPRPASGVSTDS